MARLITLVIIVMFLGGLMITLAIPHEKVKPLRGELIKIDPTNNFIVIRTTEGKKAEEVTLYIVPDTAVRVGEKIKLGYEKDAFSEFKIGDKIGVTYLVDAQDKKIAHSILKLPSTQLKPKAKRD